MIAGPIAHGNGSEREVPGALGPTSWPGSAGFFRAACARSGSPARTVRCAVVQPARLRRPHGGDFHGGGADPPSGPPDDFRPLKRLSRPRVGWAIGLTAPSGAPG